MTVQVGRGGIEYTWTKMYVWFTVVMLFATDVDVIFF